MSQLLHLLRLQQYDNGSWGYKGIDDRPDENMLDGKGFGEGLKVINEQRDDEDREAFFARVNSRPDGKEYGSNLQWDYDIISDNCLGIKRLVENGYGLNKLINHEEWLYRLYIAKQGYYLDKLANDKEKAVRNAVVKAGGKVKTPENGDLKTLAKRLIKNNINPAKYPFDGEFDDAPVGLMGIDFDKIFEEHPELGYKVGDGEDIEYELAELYEFVETLSSKFGFSWLITWGRSGPWSVASGGSWPDAPGCWNIKTSDGKTCMDLFISEDSIDKNEYIKVASWKTNGAEYIKEHPEEEYYYVRKSSYDPDREYDAYDGFDEEEIYIDGANMDVIPPANGYDGYFLNKEEIVRLLNPYDGTYDLYFCTGAPAT